MVGRSVRIVTLSFVLFVRSAFLRSVRLLSLKALLWHANARKYRIFRVLALKTTPTTTMTMAVAKFRTSPSRLTLIYIAITSKFNKSITLRNNVGKLHWKNSQENYEQTGQCAFRILALIACPRYFRPADRNDFQHFAGNVQYRKIRLITSHLASSRMVRTARCN